MKHGQSCSGEAGAFRGETGVGLISTAVQTVAGAFLDTGKVGWCRVAWAREYLRTASSQDDLGHEMLVLCLSHLRGENEDVGREHAHYPTPEEMQPR